MHVREVASIVAATVAGLLITLSTPARAQPGAGKPADAAKHPTPGSTLPLDQLKRVEQGIGDQGPASTTMRQAPADLRMPNDFAGVYRIPDIPGSPYAGWYARVRGMGGLVAVFPRSTYALNANGTPTATVPPGTQFLIGGIPNAPQPASQSAPINPLAIDGRIDSRTPQNPEPPPAPATPSPPADWSRLTSRLCTEPDYRAARIAALLAAAVRAEGPVAPGSANEQDMDPKTPK